MNRHFFTAGFTAIATVAVMSTAPIASAATLSSEVSDLLGKTEGTSEYDIEYNRVSNLYQDQAKSYSLGFEDWFAMNAFVNHERAAYGTGNAQLQQLTELNLDSLTWEAGARDVEVFFINEGAGYWNKFGYSTANPSDDTSLGEFWDEEVEVMWNGIASQDSILANGGSMALGEGYRIGDVGAGDTVNFFLRNPRGNVFDSGSAATTRNTDKLQHVTTYQYKDYLVLAYEDLYNGGDKDYNDVVIAVKGLTDTAQAAESVPEPASILGLIGLGLAGLVTKRNQENN